MITTTRRVVRAGAAVTGALIVGLLGAVAPADGRPAKDEFRIEKWCPTADDPAACYIVESEPFTQLVGGRISYEDRVYWTNPAGFTFEIARVTLTTGPGKDPGQIMGQVRWLKDSGLITLRQGTGSLADVHATGTVEYIAQEGDLSAFELVGTYHVHP
jgi:hypothetical protein